MQGAERAGSGDDLLHGRNSREDVIDGYIGQPVGCGRSGNFWMTQPAFEWNRKDSVVTETPLEPKVIRMDADGRPRSQHETVQVKSTEVEIIPWKTWAEKQATRNDNNMAKLLLACAVDVVRQHTMTMKDIPIELVRKGRVTQAIATQEIQVGGLVVPLFFQDVQIHGGGR